MKGAEKKFITIIAEHCATAPISYQEYISLALYDKEHGYYAKKQQRVGRSDQTDFYTAESLGQVFARLVVTAAEDLVGKEAASKSVFLEIAAEPGTELLSTLDTHPFAQARTIRQGEPISAKGPSIIFANEWLDALPFHRVIFKNGCWRERGVRVSPQSEQLENCLLDNLSPAVAAIAHRLPESAEEAYEIDLPLEAERRVSDLLEQDWSGLLLLFDYGKSWQTLITEYPSGTARTYRRHQQGNDLLRLPGEHDITCDLCWDPLVQNFKTAGLEAVSLETQESFFVKRASRAASAIVQNTGGRFSQERQTLMELIHPAHMGRRFQVLWGLKKA